MRILPRNPSVILDTAGPHAEKIGKLFWYFFDVDLAIFLLVIGFLIYALWKRRDDTLGEPAEPPPSIERKLIWRVSIAVGSVILILTSFVGASYVVDKDLVGLDRNPELEVTVTGHQWWWEVRYESKTPSEIFTTANEIHIPIKTKVRLKLQSSDVIHSLWVPNLAGKKDIIPGRDQDLVIEADREGIWYGRCAEFCGLQHAFMAITVFAESKEVFEAWRKNQSLPAAEPVTEEQRRGYKVFTTGACIMCHQFHGVSKSNQSNNAPDLTHLMSRSSIGAGAAPNTKGYLGGWILDPHGIKPGVHMPTILQEPGDFQALLSYLETLK